MKKRLKINHKIFSLEFQIGIQILVWHEVIVLVYCNLVTQPKFIGYVCRDPFRSENVWTLHSENLMVFLVTIAHKIILLMLALGFFFYSTEIIEMIKH